MAGWRRRPNWCWPPYWQSAGNQQRMVHRVVVQHLNQVIDDLPLRLRTTDEWSIDQQSRHTVVLRDESVEQINHDIEITPIILYRKGTKERPECGFSNAVVRVLNFYGVEYKEILRSN